MHECVGWWEAGSSGVESLSSLLLAVPDVNEKTRHHTQHVLCLPSPCRFFHYISGILDTAPGNTHRHLEGTLRSMGSTLVVKVSFLRACMWLYLTHVDITQCKTTISIFHFSMATCKHIFIFICIADPLLSILRLLYTRWRQGVGLSSRDWRAVWGQLQRRAV